MKQVITILILTFISGIHAQEERVVFTQLGLGMGLPFIPISEQEYEVDIYSGERNWNAYLRLGAGFNLSSKDQLSVFFEPNAWRSDRKAVRNEYKERLPDAFLYHDLELDNTNSVGNGLALYNIAVQYAHRFETGRLHLAPYTGFGLGFWKHRDFSYVLRAKDSNEYTTYHFDHRSKASLTFSGGLRIGWKRWYNGEIDVSYIGSLAGFNYDVGIVPHDGQAALQSSSVDFKRLMQAVRIGVILKLQE